MENLDFTYRTGITLRLDIVAHLIRFKQQDKHSAGEVLKRSAQSHADCYARRGEDGQKRAGLQTDDTHNRDYEDEIKHHPYQRKHKSGERRVDVAADHELMHHCIELADYKSPCIEYQNGNQQFECKIYHTVGNFGHRVVNRQTLQCVKSLLAGLGRVRQRHYGYIICLYHKFLKYFKRQVLVNEHDPAAIAGAVTLLLHVSRIDRFIPVKLLVIIVVRYIVVFEIMA